MDEKSLLLVEDNPDDEALILRALRRVNVGNDVAMAHDGVEALDYLFGTGQYAGRDASVMPKVVLLDIKLPKVDGLEVLRRLRADPRTKILPVVILTSSKEEEDRVCSDEPGANSFVRMPVDVGQFAEAVARLGLSWLLLNQPPAGRR